MENGVLSFRYLPLWLLPLLPVLTRSILMFRHRRLVSERLCEDELDRQAHRGVILSLSGFSFTAVIALVLLNSTTQLSLELPIYYVLWSFAASLAALNTQSYKSTMWQDQMSTALYEITTLSLVLTLASLIVSRGSFTTCLKSILVTIVLLPWLFDHAIRLGLKAQYLQRLETRSAETREEVKHDGSGQKG